MQQELEQKQKYTDALYPDKINDFIDNDGKLTEAAQEVIQEAGIVGPSGPTGAAGPAGPTGPTGAGMEPNELIVSVDSVPTATASSPDLVQTRDGRLYRKIKIGG